jgi:hypothetical protein
MALATTQDVSARLGRELTAAEDEMYEWLLQAATEQIADAADVSVEMIDGLATRPRTLWVLCVEAVVRAGQNPSGARSTQETLGQYSRSVSYTDVEKGGGLFLTDREQRMVRRAVFDSTSLSVRVPSAFDDLYCS